MPSAEDSVESGGGVFYDGFASGHDITPTGMTKSAGQKNSKVENPNNEVSRAPPSPPTARNAGGGTSKLSPAGSGKGTIGSRKEEFAPPPAHTSDSGKGEFAASVPSTPDGGEGENPRR